MSVLWEHMTPDERRRKVEIADLKYAYLMSGGTLELAEELKPVDPVVEAEGGLMTSRDVCAALGVQNIRTVAKMRLEQGLPSRKSKGKHMFAPDDVMEWANKRGRLVNRHALRAGSGA